MSVINTNMEAILAARSLSDSQQMLGKSLNRLSSGSKIVNPSDDAAGLAVSEKLDAQNLRIGAAQVNVQNAISYVQTADGFLSGMSQILSRMSELGIMAKDVTKSSSDIALYQDEFQQLQQQLRQTIGGGGSGTAIGGTAVTSPLGTYNSTELFGSTAAGGYQVTIGEASGQTMLISDMDLRDSGALTSVIHQSSGGSFDQLSLTDPSIDVVGIVSNAIQQVASERATIGASQSRLQLASSTLNTQSENLQAAISRIKDVDVAQESTQLARYQILVQSGTAMLAQANQMPQSVLKLLQ